MTDHPKNTEASKTASSETLRQYYQQDARSAVQDALPKGGRPLLFVTALSLVLFLGWAAICEIDEITRGMGKVIPSSRIQMVQNLEGGIISDIKVKEGDTVKKGQVLLTMDDTRFSSSRDEKRASQQALEARLARLTAQVENRKLAMPRTVMDESPELAAREIQLFFSNKEEMKSRLGVLQQQLEQQENDHEEMQAKSNLLKRRNKLLSEEFQLAKKLAAEGAVSRVELLRIARQVSDVEGEVMMANESLDRIKAQQQETLRRVDETKLSFVNKSRLELNETLGKLNELSAGESALEDRVDRTKVRSPVHGIVKTIMVNTEGGVVQPGMNMMEIVPVDDTLKVEARIRPEDIGFLHPGQKAIVRFTAYDFTIYGGLEGELTHISADTITDEKGDSFYLAHIQTRKNSLDKETQGVTGNNKPVIPGMVATVDIMTGKKTLLTYLLKPVLRAKQLAFTER
ncbi:HlyD family type I secretion periplasmic adaptor subunit [Endozoicomonadaceae bacterium StTr2]